MPTTTSQDDTDNGVLGRLFQAEKGDLPSEVARYLLSIDFSAEDRRRMEELAEKSQAGQLAYDERKELERFVYIGHVLAFLQSKARKSLKDQQMSG